MRGDCSRRRALATLPALAAAVAGCSVLGGSDGESADAGGDTATGTGTRTPSGTDAATPARGGRSDGLQSVNPWTAADGDPGATGRIDGAVPTTDLTARWTATRDFVNETVTEPVFNEETVLVAFERRAELLFCDHAGNVLAEPSYYGSFEKFAQSDGFLIDSRFGGIRKYDNGGQQVFEKNPGYDADFGAHPAPDALSYTRTTEGDDGRTVGRVGVYDFAGDEQVWENAYPLQPAEDRTSYRLSDLSVDPDREVLVASVLRDENADPEQYRGALLGLDLADGTGRWRLDGVNRLPINLSAGRLLSGEVRWLGDASRAPNQSLRSYHVTDLGSGEDRRVVGASDGDLGATLFEESKAAFAAGVDYLVEDRLYASGPDRRTLVAVEVPEGDRAWTYEPSSAIQCAPRAASNALVFGTREGLEFVGFDGSRVGRFELDTNFAGGIMLTPGRIYVGGDALHAVGASSG